MTNDDQRRIESYARFAILCAKQVYDEPMWNQRADEWLASGKSALPQAARSAAAAAAWTMWALAASESWAAAAAAVPSPVSCAAAARAVSAAREWAAAAAAASERAAARVVSAAAATAAAWAAREEAELDLLGIARAAGVPPPSIAKWTKLGLLPTTTGGLLLWKHVCADKTGHHGYPYRIGQSFVNDGMACVGPLGAVRGWAGGAQNAYAYLLAIEAQLIFDYDPANGVYLCIAGTPIALYQARLVDNGELDVVLVEGVDAIALIGEAQ